MWTVRNKSAVAILVARDFSDGADRRTGCVDASFDEEGRISLLVGRDDRDTIRDDIPIWRNCVEPLYELVEAGREIQWSTRFQLPLEASDDRPRLWYHEELLPPHVDFSGILARVAVVEPKEERDIFHNTRVIRTIGNLIEVRRGFDSAPMGIREVWIPGTFMHCEFKHQAMLVVCSSNGLH